MYHNMADVTDSYMVPTYRERYRYSPESAGFDNSEFIGVFST